MRTHYQQHYQNIEGHRHIHGANLGICAKAYVRAGAFQAMTAHEEVQLVSDLEESGVRIVWTARNCVAAISRQKG
jgi:thymidine phosphorylase